MGASMNKPSTIKHNDKGEGNRLQYGVSLMQGWRSKMEDAYSARANKIQTLKDWSFFAIFDGHAGRSVSNYCARNLLATIIYTREFESGDFVKGIREGFLTIDTLIRFDPNLSNLRNCGGTTVVCAFISPTQIYIANCGDSRAVLCRQGTPVFATQDHKPMVPEELKRIHEAGGFVKIKRINGILSVSRALGDFEFKKEPQKGQCEQMVSPEPEVFCQSRMDSDEFLILACDGVWDVMSNEDVCSFVHSRLKVTDSLVTIANQVVDTCLHKGSRDNMSIIIITFPGAPTPTREAIEADENLERQIEKLAREEMQNNTFEDYALLLKQLQSREEFVDKLPPGGGMESKWYIVEKVFKEQTQTPTEDSAEGEPIVTELNSSTD